MSEYPEYDEWVCFECDKQISPELVQLLLDGEADDAVCQNCGTGFLEQLNHINKILQRLIDERSTKDYESESHELACPDCGQQISPELAQRLEAGEIDNVVCQSCGAEFFKQLKLETFPPFIDDADEMVSQTEGSKFEYPVLVCMECDYLLSPELVLRLVDHGDEVVCQGCGSECFAELSAPQDESLSPSRVTLHEVGLAFAIIGLFLLPVVAGVVYFSGGSLSSPFLFGSFFLPVLALVVYFCTD